MSLTVLIDLDDTLLLNFSSAVMPAYLKALSHYIPDVAPDLLLKELMSATKKMMQNKSPKFTLEQVFDQHFYPGLGIPKQELVETLNRFYTEVFPTLRKLTEPNPEAIRIVDFAFEQGFQVAIATNPLFPKIATQQRLDWAGLSSDKYPFSLVSTFETFHFAKPEPAYYMEILTQTGWLNQQAVMIGDNYNFDIEPADQIGLAAFWLNAKKAEQNKSFQNTYSRTGAYAEIIPWLKQISTECDRLEIHSQAGLSSVLQATPAGLSTITSGLDPSSWKYRPKSDEWSITEIVCHLRDIDREINLPLLKSVLQIEDISPIEIDLNPFMNETNYYRENGSGALSEFVEIRTELLALLSTISGDDWNQVMRHAISGPTTTKDMVAFIAKHDQTHIQQVFAALQNGKARKKAPKG